MRSFLPMFLYESFFSWDYNIYCVNYFGYWNWLKTETGKIFSIKGYTVNNNAYTFSDTRSVLAQLHICEHLINLCQNKLGVEYMYVQSSYDAFPFLENFSSWDGIVDQNNELCPYYKLISLH